MWQRFTESARKAVFYAQRKAAAAGSGLIETEHLLLGLLEEPANLAVRVLNALGIEPERLRKEVAARTPQGDPGGEPCVTLSPGAKAAIELAYKEAREELGDDYIGPEHLLLGLLREKGGVAAQALAQLGFDLENARLAIAAIQVNDASASVGVASEKKDQEGPKTMWQRFTERARKVVFYAQEEAQKFGEGYVSTEHLLLGLVRESGSVSSRVLEALGVSLNRVRVEVEKQLPRGEPRPDQDMTLTPRAKRVIDLAYDEARGLNNNYIGTEHLLLGLIREGDGLAGRVLAKLGVELERARLEVMVLQDTESPSSRDASPSQKPFSPSEFTPHPWSAYNDDARTTLLRAKEEADGQNEPHLTPLHIVLALLQDPDSDAAKALRKAGLEPERLRAEVERQIVWAEGAPEDIQLSPNGRKVMDAANLEAALLSSERLGSGHILLGLYRGNPDGVGKILTKLDVKINRLRDAVQDLSATGKKSTEDS